MSKQVFPEGVDVTVFARLHMGFIDLNGGLGRLFGSIGLALENPSTRVTAWRSEDFTAEGLDSERAMACARGFITRTGIASGVRLQIAEAIPEHTGLGSGTQMALAIGTAIARLYRLPMVVRDIAALTARGARSGIGIGAFENGGLLLDGGRGENTVIPPIILRMDFPTVWRVLLVFDERVRGVHGSGELQAFKGLPEFPSKLAAELSRRILMQALPALAEHNLPIFGQAITELQCRVGDYFASAQGGGRYASADVGDVMTWLETQGVNCVGQSSWGPTGFAVVGSESEAERLLSDLNLRYPDGNLRFAACRARNEGAIVRASMALSGYENPDRAIN